MKKILVIEDELPVRENLVDLLEAEDFEVAATENGITGVLWAEENLPDLIICDVMMPAVSGHDVLYELRQNPMTETIPFIFLTAMADKNDIRQGMELGADDYLTKPFTREEVLGAIASRLAKHEKFRQQYNSERQRSEALEQQVQELQQHLDSQQKSQQQWQRALQRLNTATSMLRRLKPGTTRDRSFKMMQESCAPEIELFENMPEIQKLLDPENAELLRKLTKR